MDNEKKKRFIMLKNREYAKKKYWKNNILLTECMEAIIEYDILNDQEMYLLMEKVKERCSIDQRGKIRWNKFSKIISIDCVKEVYQYLDDSKQNYIIWDNIMLPCIKSTLFHIIQVIDDVLSVSFDTWIVDLNVEIIIEFHHEGSITLGKVSDRI